jgi:hypothetical protein
MMKFTSLAFTGLLAATAFASPTRLSPREDSSSQLTTPLELSVNLNIAVNVTFDLAILVNSLTPIGAGNAISPEQYAPLITGLASLNTMIQVRLADVLKE